MTREDWNVIEGRVLALWGRAREIDERRLGYWLRRFGEEPRAAFTLALDDLEITCEHWPSIARLYGALESARRRVKKRVVAVSTTSVDGPLTARDWREQANAIANAAARRGPQSAYLLELSDFYEANAERVGRAEQPVWPPPAISGAMGRAMRPVFHDDAREPDVGGEQGQAKC